jgi:hypothetical protein
MCLHERRRKEKKQKRRKRKGRIANKKNMAKDKEKEQVNKPEYKECDEEQCAVEWGELSVREER